MEINTSNSLILIVDDKKENLLVLETILKQDDYTVHAASSGIEALSMSIENEYDLFILDVQMPEMNGFELAKHFKGTNRTKDIPIIFLTALSQEEHHIKSGYEVGAVDYLFKPINSTLLKLKVKSFLQIHFQQKALRVGNDILEEKNKELSQFSYIVSHDLKAPLKGIIKLLEWVNEDSPAMSGEYEKKYKEIIDIAINMSTLISGFLNYARDGVDSLETENINMELLLNEAAKSKNSKSLLNFKSKIPEINSYKLLLQIIFKNIFININDSIDPKYKIEIDYSENKSFHHITLELIPFKGDEGVKSTQFTGNNIEFDLSIAYQLIENLKGNLIVVNKDDNQINISIEIPLDIQDAITPIIDKIVSYEKGNVFSDFPILITDDNPKNLLSYVSILSLNNEVLASKSGEETLKQCINGEIDLFIIDINMPGMNGYELASHLKGYSKTRDIPILFITSDFIEDNNLKKAFEIGAIDFISAPVNKVLFTLKVEMLLHLFRQFKELKKLNELLDFKNKELFLYSKMVSYILKQPLIDIGNCILDFQKKYANQYPEIDEYLKLTVDRTHSMYQLINGLLEYATAGTDQLNIEEIDMKFLINDIIKTQNVPGNFKFNISSEIPIINSYKLLLQQIISNLISNSVKYNDAEIGEITIKYSTHKIYYHKFEVSDNGPGIPDYLIDRVFDIFQKGNTKANVDSTGIGLSIVKKLVQKLNGDIWVDKKVEKGAKFVFYFPMNIN